MMTTPRWCSAMRFALASSEVRRGSAPDGVCHGASHFYVAAVIVIPVGYSLSEGFVDSRPMRWLSKLIFGEKPNADKAAAHPVGAST